MKMINPSSPVLNTNTDTHVFTYRMDKQCVTPRSDDANVELHLAEYASTLLACYNKKAETTTET